jgi:hypothetical protein
LALDAHDTLDAPNTGTAGNDDHLFPFHRMAPPPTAMQKVTDGHDTPVVTPG